ncbi:hypothetical protein DPEC_G00085030 [Dallia pectoralis]|uniref:Uncharacterized protein n=1 Tax=Dallia pectoralis TaxID=75939 RepID=A0ACC2H088_DALPE|nr:hypothetical protein DPEC_G00085030 [Dallia pectoralis]
MVLFLPHWHRRRQHMKSICTKTVTRPDATHTGGEKYPERVLPFGSQRPMLPRVTFSRDWPVAGKHQEEGTALVIIPTPPDEGLEPQNTDRITGTGEERQAVNTGGHSTVAANASSSDRRSQHPSLLRIAHPLPIAAVGGGAASCCGRNHRVVLASEWEWRRRTMQEPGFVKPIGPVEYVERVPI